MYGKRRFSRKSSSRRSSGSLRGRRSFALRKVGRRFVSKPRFATVGFSRNVEKKYFDKSYASTAFTWLTGEVNAGTSSVGAMFTSTNWLGNSFTNVINTGVPISNDMAKGLATGTDARTRIGNKIRPRYLKGAFTFTAAALDTALMKDQRGEQFASTTAGISAGYLRTTYRMMIVKDLQVNSTDAQVTWDQVMDMERGQNGVHSELNVNNMGRFIVLEDKLFTLDADTPQKTCAFTIPGSKIGSIRYNGPSSTALTDKGVYVVWAAFTMGYDFNAGATKIAIPSPNGHSRLCFMDD